jgi:hypothetical protein
MTLNEYLIEVREFLDLYGAVLWIPILVLIALALVFAPALRRRNNWVWLAGIRAAAQALTFYHDGLLKSLAEFYTYRLERPRVLDGIAFPAGSAVRLSMIPPHHIIGGNLPVSTEVLGIKLIGEFETSPPAEGHPVAIRSGTLPANMNIRGIPCGPGQFSDTGRGHGDWLASIKGEEFFSPDIRPYHKKPSVVSCTLAAEIPVAGGILRAGAVSEVRLTNEPHEIEFFGELAAEAMLHGIPCGPGRVWYRPFTIECILARDTPLFGIPLASGNKIEVIQHPFLDSLSSIQRFHGTLAQAAKAVEFDLPAGAEITVFLRKDPNSAWVPEFANFTLHKGVELVLHGATLHGPVAVSANSNGLLEVLPDYPSPGFIAFEGRRHFSLKRWSGINWMARFEGGRWTFRDTLGETFMEAVTDDKGRALMVPVEDNLNIPEEEQAPAKE